MCQAVVAEGADLGVALDGDADRVIIADERGRLVDGDQIMGLVARSWHEAGRLSGGAVVATVMSNLAFERYIRALGLDLLRAPVGDRYVVEQMRANACNLGGEQSGHVVLSDYTTTGDGLIAALQVLAVLVREGRPASEAARPFEPLPQRLRNVPVNGAFSLESAGIASAIHAAERRLGERGRLLVRVSGTEPVVRVMAEGGDDALIKAVVDDVCRAISSAGA
jgi:phosphoglucosamine mutase